MKMIDKAGLRCYLNEDNKWVEVSIIEYTDVETMEQIRSTISKYELDCKMYGPAIDEESLQLFEQKKEQLKAYMQEIEDENERNSI